MPPVVLTITLKDLTTAGLAKVQAEITKLGGAGAAAAPGVNALGGATEKAGGSFVSGAGSALKFGLALTGVQMGVEGARQVFLNTVGAMASFQSGMANVSTLIVGVASNGIGALREQLLALPAAFGSPTELTKGLYATLSAGVLAAESVAFVGQAAQTAKAGLTTLETSVNTLTTIQHAYNLEAQDTARISDIIFQTVNVGKGTFEQFSTAFASVSPMAKNLGISLEEVGATLGTLSFAFPTATQAGTALNSLMNNLIQHSGDFAAAGINVKQVIGEVGLTGLLKKLNEAMQGNDAAIQKLIPDQEGFRAALALTSTHVERQTGNLRDMGAAAGATSEAFKKQTATASAALDNLIGSLERAAQQAAPPFLAAFSGVANMLGGAITVLTLGVSGAFGVLDKAIAHMTQGLAPTADELRALIPEYRQLTDAQIAAATSAGTLAKSHQSASQLARERVAAEQLLNTTTKASETAAANLASAQATLADIVAKGTATTDERAQAEARVAVASNANANATVARGAAEVDAAAKTKAAAAAINEQTVFVNKQIEAQEKLKNAGKNAAQELQNAFAGLGQASSADLKRLADAALTNFQKIQADGQEPPERLRVLWAAALGDIKKGYSTLPDTVKDVNAQIAALPLPVQPMMDKLREAFDAFGEATIFDLKKTADASLVSFNVMQESGMATADQLEKAYNKTADLILEAYGELPTGLEATGRQIEAVSSTTANAVHEEWKKTGIKISDTLQVDATKGVAAFKIFLDGPEGAKATSASLVNAFKKSMTDITEGEFKRLPDGFAAVAAQMKPHLTALGLEIQITTDSLGHITAALVPLGTAATATGAALGATAIATTALGEAFDLSGISAEAYAANLRKIAPALDALAQAQAEATREAAGWGTITQRNIDLADLSSDATTKLKNSNINAKESFADDVPGLQKQLARAKAEFARIQREPEPLDSKGFKQHTLAALGKSIDLITEKLKGLGMDLAAAKTNPFDAATAGADALGKGLDVAVTKTDALAASTARLANQTTAAASAAASAAGNYARLAAGGKDTQRLPGSSAGDFAPGGRMPGAGKGVQPLPMGPAPIRGNPRPPGWNVPGRTVQRFAEGGIVQGSGGIDSVPALLTPGERVSTPGQDRAISVSFGGDIVVNIQGSNASSASPEALGDIAAQALVRALGPRLNESLRRGGGSRFA